MGDDNTTTTGDAARSTINQVRQIMTNELGLTRELIRQEAERLIQEAVNIKVRQMEFNGVLDKLVAAAVESVLKGSRYDQPGVTVVRDAIAQKARAWAADHVDISFKEQP